MFASHRATNQVSATPIAFFVLNKALAEYPRALAATNLIAIYFLLFFT